MARPGDSFRTKPCPDTLSEFDRRTQGGADERSSRTLVPVVFGSGRANTVSGFEGWQ
jgi:hypothetical protein